MASNKDILEAQRYNRRRLVTAFTGGTPGGRELEPKSTTRPLIIGVVLSLVLALVALIMGRFSPVLPNNWQDNTLIVVKGSGARYYTIKGVLRPVSNITSARLLAEPGKFAIAEVDASTLDGIPRGTEVGIVEAPDMLPQRTALGSDVWAACGTTGGATHTWIGGRPQGLAPTEIALVRADKATWLLTKGQRHLVTDRRIPFALGLETARVHPVSGTFLNLFAEGSPLKPIAVEDAGKPATGLPTSLQHAVIGSVLQVGDQGSTRRYLVSGPDEITPLPEVAWAIYRLGPGVPSQDAIEAAVADVSALKVNTRSGVPADWPLTIGTSAGTGQRVCAQLIASEQGLATALRTIPAPGGSGETAGNAAGVTVEGGSGALVRSTDGGTLGATSVITDLGIAYGVGGVTGTTLQQLGFAATDVQAVPGAWLELVPKGVELSSEAAWKTVRAVP